MTKQLLTIALLLTFSIVNSQNTKHVFWYKCITNNYDIAYSDTGNYGPNIQGEVVKHQGISLTASVRGSYGNQEPSPMLGNGLDNTQARSFIVWYADLCRKTLCNGATVSSAIFRGEYRDSWTGSFCNAGPIAARVGVVNATNHLKNIGAYENPDNHPETGTWQDTGNSLSGTMGFDEPGDMQVQVTRNLTIPSGHNGTVSLLEGRFFEINIKEQVEYILSNEGQFAIAATVNAGDGSTGKVSLYGFENCVAPVIAGNRWTTDGNSCHIVVEITGGTLIDKVAAEKVAAFSNDVSLSVNPNPCNPVSTITFNAGSAKRGIVKIFNATGKLVYSREINDNGSFTWNGATHTSGVYLCHLEAGKTVICRNLVLIE